MAACYSSIVIILGGWHDWIENPVLMTVKTFDSPLPSIDFPTITLCIGDEFQPDNWDLTEQVFNFFHFNCKHEDDRCKQIRKDFRPFLIMIFNLLSEKFDDLEFDQIALEKFQHTIELTPKKLDYLYWAISDNKMDLSIIDGIIIDRIGRTEELNAYHLYDDLPKVFNGTSKCDEICQELKQGIVKRFMMANVFERLHKLKLGTLLRQYSDLIGFSFTNEAMGLWMNDEWKVCNTFGEIENLIFETMKTMATEFGLNVSLHDIPNIFANGFNKIPHIQFYPLHSICNAGNIYTMKLVSTFNFEAT